MLFTWSTEGGRGAYRNFDLSNIFPSPPLYINNDRSLTSADWLCDNSPTDVWEQWERNLSFGSADVSVTCDKQSKLLLTTIYIRKCLEGV